MKSYGFPKHEKLKSRKVIGQLFDSGASFHIYPIRIIYLDAREKYGEKCMVKCGFTVPKRRFRKTVDRNKIKRRMREAFRLNKDQIYNSYPRDIQMIWIYTGTEILPYFRIEQAAKRIFDRLINRG